MYVFLHLFFLLLIRINSKKKKIKNEKKISFFLVNLEYFFILFFKY